MCDYNSDLKYLHNDDYESDDVIYNIISLISKYDYDIVDKELNSAKWNLERIKEAEEKNLTKEEEIVEAPSYTISNVMSSTNNKPLVRSLTKKF